jgi:hypothetical protein
MSEELPPVEGGDDDPLAWVMDRLTILRAAHQVLTEFGMPFEVDDLLETGSWLAGDHIDDEGVTVTAVHIRELDEEEGEEDGADS